MTKFSTESPRNSSASLCRRFGEGFVGERLVSDRLAQRAAVPEGVAEVCLQLFQAPVVVFGDEVHSRLLPSARPGAPADAAERGGAGVARGI